MSQFKDLDDIFDPLVLTISGKDYTIPEPSFEAGARILGVIDGTEKLTDEQFFRLLLSDAVFDELLTDGVSFSRINRVVQAALADFKYGRNTAVALWETGGDPKALETYREQTAPNRAQRRSKSTAAARKTR